MKQLLIYNDLKPVTRDAHGDLSLKRSENFAFARETNAVPLVAAEFANASDEFAIVFTNTPDGVIPAVILGEIQGVNGYVTADGRWDARYIPAFIRRYPFVFAADPENKTFTLMVDETFEGFNRAGKGERLFDADGAQTTYTNQVVAFQQEYEVQFRHTQAFGQKLTELGLLDPVEARLPLPEGQARTLTGFSVVNRDKLKALDGAKAEELLKSDGLELIYLHLFSLRNFGRLNERAAKLATGQ